MKSIRNRVCIAILFVNAVCGVAIAGPSLCAPAESVIFSCATARSKSIALCIDNRTRMVTYRFGRVGKIEMAYSAKEGDESGFFYNHYIRAGVDYTRIAFVKAGYEYSVFRNYDATESRVPNYGVAVSRGGDDEVQIKCQSQVVDSMSQIIKHLKCDESSALGCS